MEPTAEEVAVQEAAAEAERVAAEEAARTAAEAETPEQKAEKEALALAESKEAERTRRYSEVTKQRDEEKRRREEAERMATLAMEMAAKAGKPEEKKTDADQKPVAPKFADFNDPDAFATAMTEHAEKIADWKVRQALPAHQAEQEKRAQEQRQQSEVQRIEAEYQENRKEAMAELTDFEEIAENPDLQISPSMAAAMKASGKLAPRLLYYLGQNPAEAARISRLSPGMQFMEIGALKAAVAQPKPKPKPLPDPIKPQGAGRSTTKAVDEMSMDEYAAHRNAQLKEKRAAR